MKSQSKVSEIYRIQLPINSLVPAAAHQPIRAVRRPAVREGATEHSGGAVNQISRNEIFCYKFSNVDYSVKPWPICKKSDIFEILIERTTRSPYWKLNLVKVEGSYEGF